VPNNATILIGADLCPIEGNRPYFEQGDAQSLFNDLLPELRQADLVIANLECPLIEHPSPIPKTGPTFGESPACINGIKQAGIDVLCLANNHILDHGPAGLKNTLDVCARSEIATVGAGENLAAARRILIRKIGDLRIGFLAVAEREFSIATRQSPGANPLDLIDFVRNVRAVNSDVDYLIVLLHGSDEFHVPTPRIQNTCRFMIEMGADAVVVQHPHELGGYELYQGRHIVYGQGALIMDEAIYRRLHSFHRGYLVKLLVDSSSAASLEIVPFVQSDPVPGARRMPPDQELSFRSALQERARLIQDEEFVQGEWLKFCQAQKYDYLNALLGYSRPLAKLNSRGWLASLLNGRKALLRARNVVSCETHHEAIQTIFAQSLV
jgi:poly-gamma-glutamate synthesis protein (capsule biosynthesis protein)